MCPANLRSLRTFYSLHASCRVRDETSGLALCRLALSRGLLHIPAMQNEVIEVAIKGSCRPRMAAPFFSAMRNKTL